MYTTIWKYKTWKIICIQIALDKGLLAKESLHVAYRLRYFSSYVIYMVIKIKIFIMCNAKLFDCENFRKDWISTCINVVECVFLVRYFHIWSFTNVDRKSVGLEPVINSYQFPIHSCMMLELHDEFLHTAWAVALSYAKTVVYSEKWTKRILFENLYILL